MFQPGYGTYVLDFHISKSMVHSQEDNIVRIIMTCYWCVFCFILNLIAIVLSI